jgi:hypothetical protein
MPHAVPEKAMSELADIRPLVGRSFVTRSGKVCRVERLGEGALRVVWQGSRSDITPADEQEFLAWAESVLGPLHATTSRGRAQEAQNFRQWRNRR